MLSFSPSSRFLIHIRHPIHRSSLHHPFISPFLLITWTPHTSLSRTPLLSPKRLNSPSPINPPRSILKIINHHSLFFPESLDIRFHLDSQHWTNGKNISIPDFSRRIRNAEWCLGRIFWVCTSVLCTSSLSSSLIYTITDPPPTIHFSQILTANDRSCHVS